MKDISIYFSPVDISGKWHEDQIGAKIVANNKSFPEIQKNSCALIYVPEFRGLIEAKKLSNDQSKFREAFYELQTIATVQNYVSSDDLDDSAWLSFFLAARR